MERMDQLIKLQSTLKKVGYSDDLAIAKILLGNGLSDQEFNEYIKRLFKREPWQYIHEKVLFRSVTLKVDQNVLIPRIETEMVVDLALIAFRESIDKNVGKILYIDIGTGSGAIPIAFCKELLKENDEWHKEKGSKLYHETELKIIASDFSENALKVANENATTNELSNVIEFTKSDLLKSSQIHQYIRNLTATPTSSLLITANLPYISESEYEGLDDSVKDWEPISALVGGKNGDEMIINLLDQLTEIGVDHITTVTVILEVESSQIENICTKAISFGYTETVVLDQFATERFLVLKKTTDPTS